MERVQRNYITKNLTKLARCTKNTKEWEISLISNNFVSQATLSKLKKENPDDFSLVSHMYLECTKTPDYDLLIETLDGSENDSAVEILRNINYEGSSHFAKGNQQSHSSPDDYELTENGLTRIADILKGTLENKWSNVQSKMLSPSEREAISDENNFGIRVLTDLETWKESQREKATFNKLHDIIKEVDPDTAGLLMKSKSDIKNSCN